MTTIDGLSLLDGNSLHAEIVRSVVDDEYHAWVQESPDVSFIQSILGPLIEEERSASDAVERFIDTGSSLDYTEAVLAVSKIRSDIELYATLRDKMIQSYQQFLHMQI